MTYMQRMGTDGLIPAQFAHIYAAGNTVAFFKHWTGAKAFGTVVKNDGENVVIREDATMQRYGYEIVRH